MSLDEHGLESVLLLVAEQAATIRRLVARLEDLEDTNSVLEHESNPVEFVPPDPDELEPF